MINEDGVRIIDLSIEVIGTPEQVWEAIATGRGATAWMQHTEVEGREGGRYAFDMGLGGGLNESGYVSRWEPPHRFATRDVRWQPVGSRAPSSLLATEWVIEPVAGGRCTVRMVMSGFGSGQTWDDEVEGMANGMKRSLIRLRVHLDHQLN